jgi:DNA-directed RNA polymerase specialized sigma24 family protein
MSQQEVAEILGCDRTTVAYHEKKALQKIRLQIMLDRELAALVKEACDEQPR